LASSDELVNSPEDVNGKRLLTAPQLLCWGVACRASHWNISSVCGKAETWTANKASMLRAHNQPKFRYVISKFDRGNS